MQMIERAVGRQAVEPSGGGSQIVAANKIQMLGLDAIKLKLGAKWERMSGLVDRYFEAAIRRELRPGDTFCRSGEAYLILFRDLPISEAQLKCTVIVQDVCRKLFGEEGEEISVRSLAAAVDFIDLAAVQNQLQLSAVLERDGREVLFSNKPSVGDRQAAPPLRVKAGLGTTIHTVAQESPSFVYRALWDTARSVMLTYICQLVPDTCQASTPFTLPAVACEGEDEQCALDIMALQACLKRATMLRQAGLRVLLATPFHFDTLCRPRLWTRYRARLDGAGIAQLRDLAFLVHGFDSGVPNIRLCQELPKLSHFSRQLFCLSDDGEDAGLRFRNTGAHAIGIARAPDTGDRPWNDRLKNLSRMARDNSLHTFALGTATRSAAINALGSGARYIEGQAVRPAVADPRNAFTQEIEDLYRDRLGAV